jgi:hypothetical protein
MTPVGWSTDSWADGSWATGAWGEVEGANYPGWADGAWAAGTWAVGAWGESAALSVTIDTPGGITVAGQSFTFAWSVPWDAGAITIEGQSVFAGFVLDLALDATEAQDTAALSLDVETNERSLALAATEAQDTADLDATVTVSASLDATEAADTFAATLLRQVNLALAATEAADTLAISALNISAPPASGGGGVGITRLDKRRAKDWVDRMLAMALRKEKPRKKKKVVDADPLAEIPQYARFVTFKPNAEILRPPLRLKTTPHKPPQARPGVRVEAVPSVDDQAAEIVRQEIERVAKVKKRRKQDEELLLFM